MPERGGDEYLTRLAHDLEPCPRWRSDGSGCNSKPVWINERAG